MCLSSTGDSGEGGGRRGEGGVAAARGGFLRLDTLISMEELFLQLRREADGWRCSEPEQSVKHSQTRESRESQMESSFPIMPHSSWSAYVG